MRIFSYLFKKNIKLNFCLFHWMFDTKKNLFLHPTTFIFRAKTQKKNRRSNYELPIKSPLMHLPQFFHFLNFHFCHDIFSNLIQSVVSRWFDLSPTFSIPRATYSTIKLSCWISTSKCEKEKKVSCLSFSLRLSIKMIQLSIKGIKFTWEQIFDTSTASMAF